MGTRGAFGVIIGEVEKISYNQYDSYPEGNGIENLKWIRAVIEDGRLDEIRQLANGCRVVSDDVKPTEADIEALAGVTNLNVSGQSTDDWYCLTRDAHGDLGALLECGYMLDGSNFPLESLFCEWGYIVDLDKGWFEVYKGFQEQTPTSGRWAGRPTTEEDTENYIKHLEQCFEDDRKPWRPRTSQYKAIQLVASWPLDALPSDEDFLGYFELESARSTIGYYNEYPSDVVDLIETIRAEGRAKEGTYAAEWAQIENDAFAKLKPSDAAGLAVPESGKVA